MSTLNKVLCLQCQFLVHKSSVANYNPKLFSYEYGLIFIYQSLYSLQGKILYQCKPDKFGKLLTFVTYICLFRLL